jgi:asparagine synthase (glutamine-hydrolysing)
MCGITGFLDFTRTTTAGDLRAIVTRMADALRHRGPDDAGVWVDPAAGVALGHRRLSILDLSPAGHQPMASHNGRYWIAYNGEVYNHLELRRDLAAQGVTFRGTSDTETLLEAFTAWGIQPTIQRCRGLFAIALYDTQQRELTLVRDHLGIKPLYFGRQGNVLLFASELKALREHPAFRNEIDRDILPQFLRHNYVPGPYSIYKGIEKLPAGTLCTIRLDDPRLEPRPYWSFTDIAIRGAQSPLRDDPAAITERLAGELSRAVSEQMLSDVPLGAFLSGGIDSSLVVALMQQQSPRPVRTFTIGFEIDDYNEAPFALAVAKHLKTDHTEYYVTAAEARDVIPRLPSMYDEPFADSSQIPTFLVCQLARKDVTVVLSGDGGDELFCGYFRYFAALAGTRGGKLPAAIRHPASLAARAMARCLPRGKWKKFCQRAGSFLSDADPDQRYLRGMSHWPLEEQIVIDAVPLPTMFLAPADWPGFAERQQRWQWLDTLNYLPDDILVKVDRASMAVALEARVPLLDPKVVELAWQIPHNLKVRGWTGKRILRDLLARHVPRELFERPKKGFGVPIAEWLRGPLRDWAESLLSEQRLHADGYFRAGPIRTRWAEHLSGRVDWAYLLWDVLMFQAWLDETRRT